MSKTHIATQEISTKLSQDPPTPLVGLVFRRIGLTEAAVRSDNWCYSEKFHI